MTVSVSEFRKNLSDYLEKVKEGEEIVVRDEREREDLAELRPPEEKNWDEIMKAVEKAYGMWADIPEDEWKEFEKRRERMRRNWRRKMKRLWGE